MKKIKPWVKIAFERSSLREFRKKKYRIGLGKIYGEFARQQNVVFPPEERTGTPLIEPIIALSGDLDLLGNPDETLKKFKQFSVPHRTERANTLVRVLLDRVTSLDAPSILFLCSRIHALAERKFTKVFGTYPHSPKALHALHDANFNSFLSNSPPSSGGIKPSLELIHGGRGGVGRIDTSVPRRIQLFLKERNPNLDLEEIDTIYLAVVECLENIRHHAYGRQKESDHCSGWFVVGLHDQDTQTSSVAILDRGVGIYQTVSNQFPGIFGITFKHVTDVLEEATSGLRTQTQEHKRGKGFRTLMQFATEADGRRFHVLSSGAMITWRKGAPPLKRYIPRFLGTIVCIEISSRREQ